MQAKDETDTLQVQAGGSLFYGRVTSSVFYRLGSSGLGFLNWGHCNFRIWFTSIWFLTTHFLARNVGLSIAFQKRSSEWKYSSQSPPPHSAASVRRDWAKHYGELRGNQIQGKSQTTWRAWRAVTAHSPQLVPMSKIFALLSH